MVLAKVQPAGTRYAVHEQGEDEHTSIPYRCLYRRLRVHTEYRFYHWRVREQA